MYITPQLCISSENDSEEVVHHVIKFQQLQNRKILGLPVYWPLKIYQ